MAHSQPGRIRGSSGASDAETGPELGDQFVAASHDAMIGVDERGEIVLWNGGAERLFGHSADHALGRTLDFIIPAPMRGEHSQAMQRLVDGGRPQHFGATLELPAVHADGREFPIELCLSSWRRNDRMVFGAVIRDASARREAQDRLHSLAHFDQLTMLPNRNLFLQRLQSALEDPGDAVALIVIDLDRFSEINDAAGHAVGDQLLRQVGVTLKQLFPSAPQSAGAKSPTVGRIGANDFGIVLPGDCDLHSAVETSDRALCAVKAALAGSGVGGGPVTASVGVTIAPEHGRTAAKLLANADFAVRRAKLDGGDRRQLFMPAQRHAMQARRELEAELAQAERSGEFEIFYQPQVRLSDRMVVGAEALLRWRHRERGLLAPGSFIHALESASLCETLGDWVLRTSCAQAAAWRRALRRPFRIGVNFFDRQLLSSDVAERVRSALDAAGLPPEALEVEITESVMTGPDTTHVRRVRSIRELGVGISFDDYGTGYASLSLLKRYPITRLKIDRSFVRDLSVDEDDAAIVELILTLGRRLGLEVIAEGIETTDQEARLIDLGCSEGQGYLFGRPMPAEEFAALLKLGGKKGRALVA
ncbi:MAG: EAL domain-containing protein [Hansschlegelia sp.]